MKLLIFLLFFSFSCLGFDSFIYDLDQLQDGENGLHVIEDKLAKIIYPKGYKAEADRVLNLIHSIHESYESELQVKSTKIKIVLRPYTAYSNAFVGLAPKMSEFVTVPYMHNELGHMSWIDLLAIHEYRHVVQQQKELDQGDQILYYLLGEAGMGFHSVIKFPRWYYEGDAVYAETKFSSFARGDTPQFLRDFKALAYDDDLNYDKAYLGSLRSYYPDYYKMGYIIMSYLHIKYGTPTVERMIQYANDRFLNFYAFENAIRVYTGKTVEEIFKNAQDFFRAKWKKYDVERKTSNLNIVTRDSEFFTNYRAVAVSGDTLIAFKGSLKEIGQFVKIDKNGEKHLFYPTYFSDDSFSLDGNNLVYSDILPHLRYGQKSKSVIKLFNLKNNEEKILVNEGFNYVPAINGKQLLYVNYSNGKYRVTLKNLDTRIKSIVYESSYRIASVGFWKNKPVFIEYKNNNSLIRTKREVLREIKNATAWSLKSNKSKLFYLSNEEGVTNLFSIDGQKRAQKHITSKFGLLSFDVNDKVIHVSDYSKDGAKIKKTSVNSKAFAHSNAMFKPLSKEINKVSTKPYSERKLKTFENFWNLHSWSLLPDVVGNNYYFSLKSRNVLNTFSASLGYTYNFIEATSGFYSTMSFSSPFAIWDLGLQTTERKNYDSDTNDLLSTWQENQIEFGPRVNLNFSRGKWAQALSVSLKGSILDAGESKTTSRSELDDTRLLNKNVSAIYTLTKRMAAMDLQPNYGVELFYDYIKGDSISGVDSTGEQTTAVGSFYLPSFGLTGFKLTGMYESVDLLGYDYGSYLPFSRGYASLTSKKWSGGSFDFVFPIAFTEFDIYNWFYVKRIKGNLFYDYLTSYNGIPVRSTGAEVSFLTHVLRNYDAVLDIGIRYSRRIELQDNNTEVFLDTVFSY